MSAGVVLTCRCPSRADTPSRPERAVDGPACCSMTDMSWSPARATMSQPHAHAVWDAPDRDAAIAAAVEAHGENGSKLLNGATGPGLAGSTRTSSPIPPG